LKGNVTQKTLDRFFDAGYTHGNVVDVVLAVAEITVTNYLHNITQIPIDFPLAPELAIS
jgi:alkylhydroperoxidase family enzyme